VADTALAMFDLILMEFDDVAWNGGCCTGSKLGQNA
jgi:hypothetical protein